VISGARLVAFLACTDLDRSAVFYTGPLGLTLLERSPFAVVLEGGGTVLRVTRVETVTAAPYTVLGWDVDDLDTSVTELRARGVEFLRYAGMDQDRFDAWQTPSGTRVAWFADPDGNTLSIQQHPAA